MRNSRSIATEQTPSRPSEHPTPLATTIDQSTMATGTYPPDRHHDQGQSIRRASLPVVDRRSCRDAGTNRNPPALGLEPATTPNNSHATTTRLVTLLTSRDHSPLSPQPIKYAAATIQLLPPSSAIAHALSHLIMKMCAGTLLSRRNSRNNNNNDIQQ